MNPRIRTSIRTKMSRIHNTAYKYKTLPHFYAYLSAQRIQPSHLSNGELFPPNHDKPFKLIPRWPSPLHVYSDEPFLVVYTKQAAHTPWWSFPMFLVLFCTLYWCVSALGECIIVRRTSPFIFIAVSLRRVPPVALTSELRQWRHTPNCATPQPSLSYSTPLTYPLLTSYWVMLHSLHP